MEVQYFPTLNCNLNCEYCVSHRSTEFSLSENKKTLLNIFKLFKSKNHGILYIVGGEPSFHKNFIEMMEYIHTLKTAIFPSAKIELQTNLSMNLDRYKSVYNYVDVFSVSLHFIELHRKKILNRFTKNLEFIKNKIYNLDIMLENGTDEEIELEEKYILQLLDKKYKCKCSEMIYAFYGGYDNRITEKFKDFYAKYNPSENRYDGNNTNELFTMKPCYRGYFCEATANYYSILGNGNTYACASHYNEGLLSNRSPLGNINDNYKKFISNEPIICDYDTCCGCFYFHKSKEKFNPIDYLDD